MSEQVVTREVVWERFAAIDAVIPSEVRRRNVTMDDIAKRHVQRTQFDLTACLREMATGLWEQYSRTLHAYGMLVESVLPNP